MASETTPLIGTSPTVVASSSSSHPGDGTKRYELYRFLEAQTYYGILYERFIIGLIFANVLCFIIGTVFVQEYNPDNTYQCSNLCDALFFGNYEDNGLQFLNIGTTSVLELVTIFVFTIEYIVRLYTCDYEDPTRFKGWVGRFRYLPTFFSLVDLASTVPFYIDWFVLSQTNLASSAFLRMFRLLRMMRVEGRYDTALTMIDDVIAQQKGIMGTALFIGFTTWLTVSTLYYVLERKSLDMIYCGAAPPDACNTTTGEDIDTSDCTIDEWGFVNCPACPPTEKDPEPCYNLYQSIPMASYYALLNCFGEFPLMEQHNTGGKIVATITAILAVAFFALPTGIVGNGFETVIEEKRQQDKKILQERPIEEYKVLTPIGSTYTIEVKNTLDGSIRQEEKIFVPSTITYRGQLYTFLHAMVSEGSKAFDFFINFLVVLTVLSFMIGTTTPNKKSWLYISSDIYHAFDIVEIVAVLVFTIEYILRVYSIAEDPKYNTSESATNSSNSMFCYKKFGAGGGRLLYMTTFLSIVDLLSFLPWYIEYLFYSSLPEDTKDIKDNLSIDIVGALRLLRIFRFERYTHAFLSFDDIIHRNLDILSVTGFTAVLVWIFFSVALYFTERDNPDEEMSSNYNNVPNAMWISLLNLSGESPLCQYSLAGKVLTGVLALFATGIFGIPIGILGSGFEVVIEEENEDTPMDEEDKKDANKKEEKEKLATDEDIANHVDQILANSAPNNQNDEEQAAAISSLEIYAYNFVNGIGSPVAKYFEMLIYALIFITIAIGAWQTVEGQATAFNYIEWIAIIVFTIEYIIRFIGCTADPIFAKKDGDDNKFLCRVRYAISFFSIIDLLAIVPFYIVYAIPTSAMTEYDNFLRMFRIIRLVKLDKYVPSITLIDDVIRLKYKGLCVAFYAAITLAIIFSALLYVLEHNDVSNVIDNNLPLYGCYENGECTESYRFRSFFDSFIYTSIHLTGDYPIIQYTWPTRIVNFFMVIAAVGVVSIPSVLVANGFQDIVFQKKQEKLKSEKKVKDEECQEKEQEDDEFVDDDWYEIRYKELEGVDPPPSKYGPKVDEWETYINELLNGKVVQVKYQKGKTGKTFIKEVTEFTTFATCFRIFIFTIIIANIVAVLLESIPTIDRAVGNHRGNFFDVFEEISVFVFAIEYILRLFSAPKSREALYSTAVYATTFFGIVDFLSTAPWFVEQFLIAFNVIGTDSDTARIFRMFRIFRILQLEDFFVAFSKLDNVFRASKDVFKATGLLALIIWVGCGALFYIFELNNPNWRECDNSVPSHTTDGLGCYDFASTEACNEYYPGMCEQKSFNNMPNSLYYTAVFLVGEWGVVDFTWPGRIVCLFLCIVGIALYALPVGILFETFAGLIGLADAEDEEEEEDDGDDDGEEETKQD